MIKKQWLNGMVCHDNLIFIFDLGWLKISKTKLYFLYFSIIKEDSDQPNLANPLLLDQATSCKETATIIKIKHIHLYIWNFYLSSLGFHICNLNLVGARIGRFFPPQ